MQVRSPALANVDDMEADCPFVRSRVQGFGFIRDIVKGLVRVVNPMRRLAWPLHDRKWSTWTGKAVFVREKGWMRRPWGP